MANSSAPAQHLENEVTSWGSRASSPLLGRPLSANAMVRPPQVGRGECPFFCISRSLQDHHLPMESWTDGFLDPCEPFVASCYVRSDGLQPTCDGLHLIASLLLVTFCSQDSRKEKGYKVIQIDREHPIRLTKQFRSTVPSSRASRSQCSQHRRPPKPLAEAGGAPGRTETRDCASMLPPCSRKHK